jgi:hypothetical protein
MSNPKRTLNELVLKRSPLSQYQHAICRDAGYSREEAKEISGYDYQELQQHVKCKGSSPATPMQMKYLESRNIDVGDVHPTFGKVRLALRALAQEENDDEKYLAQIRLYDRDNAGRRNRARNGAKPRAGESTAQAAGADNERKQLASDANDGSDSVEFRNWLRGFKDISVAGESLDARNEIGSRAHMPINGLAGKAPSGAPKWK